MREALIVWGGWSGHEPQECAEIIKTMLEEDGFKVYLEHGTEALADPSVHDLSLVVPIMTMSKIEKEEVKNLAAAAPIGQRDSCSVRGEQRPLPTRGRDSDAAPLHINSIVSIRRTAPANTNSAFGRRRTPQLSPSPLWGGVFGNLNAGSTPSHKAPAQTPYAPAD